ncbi:hypothetical protein DA718_09760 [Klebsiella huaxiensis]|uniref:hypothetical protein n=1 Tax=Klebsiella huaxiensis TaxID=2153354 RepID=UPI00102EEA80|nr:hypothetical protein [Klebsiella huaxiensis]QBG07462.1 hypothetical protein DA718_09760 [Klebsiella huaxiensis]
MIIVFLSFVVVKAFAGPIGIVFQPLNYVPTLLMFPLLLMRWAKDFITKVSSIVIISLIGVYFLIGIGNSSIAQASFGLYVLIPFLYCLAYSHTLQKYIFSDNQKYYYFFLLTCCAGIYYVSEFGAPWLGGIVNIGGVDKVISRDWTTSGTLRNPGFTAASFDAATLLMICSLLIISKLASEKKYFKAIFIFAIALHCIYLTTTKTTVITLILVLLMMLLPLFISRNIIKATVISSVVFTYIYMIPHLKYDSYDPKNTLLMRMYDTWPKAILILDDTLSLWIGKGFGAIGTPALYFSPKTYSPADNILVYMYVIGGFISLTLTAIFLFKFTFSKFYESKFEKKYYLISFCVLIGGVTYNLFESVFYSISLGLIVGCLFDKENCSTFVRKN